MRKVKEPGFDFRKAFHHVAIKIRKLGYNPQSNKLIARKQYHMGETVAGSPIFEL